MSRHSFHRGYRVVCVRSGRRVCTMILTFFICGEPLVTVIEEKMKLASLEQKCMGSKIRDDFEALLAAPQSVLTQLSVQEKVQKPVQNVVHDTLAREVELLSDLSLGADVWNVTFEKLREEKVRCWI